ncbi:MAG: hypothetical protein CMJ49_07845 [Planctomycetaceae bacterium]|nr:hypothetical protein [Planctomycetaceae bacterium]
MKLMQNTLTMRIEPAQGKVYSIDVDVEQIGLSRHAGRDIARTRADLETVRHGGCAIHDAAGVCLKSRCLLTNERAIEVQGPQTSGEVEFVAIRHAGELFISVGSDHNDRSIDQMWTEMLGKVSDTAKSKQMAPAVVATTAWRYEDIKAHWDGIALNSYVTIDDRRVAYQAFTLGDLLDLEYYLALGDWLSADGSVLFGGSNHLLPTIPSHVFQMQRSAEGVVFPDDFQFEMIDSILSRRIEHAYTIHALEPPGSLSL